MSQGSLTVEALPVEKVFDPETGQESSPTELKNTCFMGTSVQSGTAIAVVITTGAHTYLGSMARSITEDRTLTSFDQGLNRFTWLMMQFMAVMVPLVFLINRFTKHDWKAAFFFALAVSVGRTPEMLPMIVSVCLSKGALAMSSKRVIVKRLNSIQNFGAMDVLCTDKTGTLTQDRVVLMRHCNVAGRDSDVVLSTSIRVFGIAAPRVVGERRSRHWSPFASVTRAALRRASNATLAEFQTALKIGIPGSCQHTTNIT